MNSEYPLDALVRYRLRQWPQCPPGLKQSSARRNGWLRGRPVDKSTQCLPFLKLPGSDRLKTLPDGLWLNFGGTPEDGYVDIFAIEACGSVDNFFDKRSRFAASTHSMLAACPVPWLVAPVAETDPTPRWRITGLLREEPRKALILPVRDIRVLYGLKAKHYDNFIKTQVPHAHEYFVPMDTLVAQQGHEDPALRELVSRASVTANFLTSC